jgi:hypothetical protein
LKCPWRIGGRRHGRRSSNNFIRHSIPLAQYLPPKYSSVRMSLEARLPTPVSSTAFSETGLLAIGTDDGALRVYESPYTRVWKAVRQLGSEVASVAFTHGNSVSVWVASGRHVRTNVLLT